MADIEIEKLQSAAYEGTSNTLVERVEGAYDRVVFGTGKKIWKGMVAVAASGFGKGVLIAAAALIIGGAVLAAASADAGLFGYAVSSFDGISTLIPGTTEQALVEGASHGFGTLLTSGWGMAAMLAGGVLGAVADVRKEQNKISAQQAADLAAGYAAAREQQPAQAPEQTVKQETTPAVAAIAEAQPWDQPQAGTKRQPTVINISCNPTAYAHHTSHVEREATRRENQPFQGVSK